MSEIFLLAQSVEYEQDDEEIHGQTDPQGHPRLLAVTHDKADVEEWSQDVEHLAVEDHSGYFAEHFPDPLVDWLGFTALIVLIRILLVGDRGALVQRGGADVLLSEG